MYVKLLSKNVPVAVAEPTTPFNMSVIGYTGTYNKSPKMINYIYNTIQNPLFWILAISCLILLIFFCYDWCCGFDENRDDETDVEHEIGYGSRSHLMA
ncbi:hypothetical protein NQ315_010017 [Exocentrus adspersus]|uniref:Uncharacterized protein n=1 Tax=Exocentrus adspersus TaxID=1586481 RepID=A0AAV8VK14_9CUCU|nr:hypothetical protein NQ315_010017 [Exocentrus adspersus]